MEIGQIATVGGVTGTVLEIIETETERKVKLETEEGKIAILTYFRAGAAGALGTMKLG